jgi:hypothetical protein
MIQTAIKLISGFAIGIALLGHVAEWFSQLLTSFMFGS